MAILLFGFNGFSQEKPQISARIKYTSNATIPLRQQIALRSYPLELSYVFSPFPDFQKITFGGILQPTSFLEIGLGDIFYSGFISRFRNPKISSQNPLQSGDIPHCGLKFSLPGISNGPQDKESFFAKCTFGDFAIFSLFNIYATATPQAGQSSFMFALNYDIFDTKKTTHSNALRSKSSIFLAWGQNFVHPTNENLEEESFFPEEKIFEQRALRYLALEGDFISPIFKIFLSSLISESVFRKITGFVRSEANLNLDFFNLKMKFSYLGPDFITEKNTFAKNSVDFFINPQLNFFFFRRFSWELETGIGAQIGTDEERRGENLPMETTFSAAAKAISKNFRSQVDFTAADCLHPGNRTFKIGVNAAYKPYYNGFAQEASAKFTLNHLWEKSTNEMVFSLKGSFRPMKEFKATFSPKITFTPGKSTLLECGAKVYYIQSRKNMAVNTYCEMGFSMRKNENEEKAETRFSWGLGGKITVK